MSVLNDHVGLGIELLAASAFLIAMLTVFQVAAEVNSTLSEQQAIQLELREYQKYNQYDNKIVYAQDAISAVLEFRGQPVVYVKIGATTHAWSGTYKSSVYTTAAVSNLITSTRKYRATITRNVNGELLSINFVAI